MTNFLIKFYGYKLESVSEILNDERGDIKNTEYHCISLTSDIKKGLESIKNSYLYQAKEKRICENLDEIIKLVS